VVFGGVLCYGLDNLLGLTPQMGYNSWYDYGCSSTMTESAIQETAQSMIQNGLTKLGYQYINLDDCWALGRYGNGTVYPDPDKFPSGMAALATYMHDNGLLFGLYSDRGTQTCGGRPGAFGYETIDAQTYAEWGVDYLKEDSCYASSDPVIAFQEYGLMRDALAATNASIFFSLCGWEYWYAPVGAFLANSWRIGPDDTDWPGVLVDINTMANFGLQVYSGPGGWNDPCLLLSQDFQGNYRMTEPQSRAQFTMWAMMASPLLISGNVRQMSSTNLETYSIIDVIAINQDSWGRQGWRVRGANLTVTGDVSRQRSTTGTVRKGASEQQQQFSATIAVQGGDVTAANTNVWARPLKDSGGGWALTFINTDSAVQNITCSTSCFRHLTDFDTEYRPPIANGWHVYDIWNNVNLADLMPPFEFTAADVSPEGGIQLLRLTSF